MDITSDKGGGTAALAFGGLRQPVRTRDHQWFAFMRLAGVRPKRSWRRLHEDEALDQLWTTLFWAVGSAHQAMVLSHVLLSYCEAEPDLETTLLSELSSW